MGRAPVIASVLQKISAREISALGEERYTHGRSRSHSDTCISLVS